MLGRRSVNWEWVKKGIMVSVAGVSLYAGEDMLAGQKRPCGIEEVCLEPRQEVRERAYH